MRDYAKEDSEVQCKAEQTTLHPLIVEEKVRQSFFFFLSSVALFSLLLLAVQQAQKTMTVTRITETAEPSVKEPVAEVPKQKPVVFDPLGVMKASADPLGVTSNKSASMPDAPFSPAPSIMEKQASALKTEESQMDDMIEEGFVPWTSKKGAILQKYTTNERVGILVSFMQDVPNRVNMPVDSTQGRLKELERGEDDEERQLEVSQQDYVRHIESLETELRKAWDEEQNRVRALKIVIRCAKVLGDTSVIQFYPSKFVLISEILDSFGDLVYNRILERGASDDGQGRMRPLKPDFRAEDVSEHARETCKNWFHKVASIRELLPRLYVEMALLHCYRFIYNDPFETLLNRINMQLRGVCDPIVATYARAYLARVGTRVKPRLKPYLVTGFMDHLEVMKQNIDSGLVERICQQKNIDPLKYYDLYSPALDWMLQCLAHNNRSTATLMAILDKYKVMGDALTLNHIIRNFHPDVAATHCLLFCDLIKSADDRGLGRDRLWSTLGASLIMSPPPTEAIPQLWQQVWTEVQKEADLVTFVNLAEIWIDFPVKYLSNVDQNQPVLVTALRDLLARVRPEKAHQLVQDQLQSMTQKILSGFPDYSYVAKLDVFHELVDLFSGEHQTEVHKAILRSFRAFQGTSINDPVLIEHVFTAAKSAHDSINSLSFEDERRQVSELLCTFVTKVDFGREVEKQLTFLSDARRAFGNFDTVKARLVHAVAALTMKTLALAGGTHTSRTTPFVRACVAFCFITIPSIESVYSRLDLYLVASNVALLNGAIGQAEDLAKAAVKLFGEIPAFPTDLELAKTRRKCEATEARMLEFVMRFASLLVVIPGHPELGPFYLFGGLLKVLGSFQFLPGSEVPTRVAMGLIATLCALAQEELPYEIKNLDSNNVLYGGDPMYLEELNKLVDQLVERILAQLTALKESNPSAQKTLAAEFFDLTVSIASLNAKSGNLSASLFNIAKESPPTGHLKAAHNALTYRSGPLHQAMHKKLVL